MKTNRFKVKSWFAGMAMAMLSMFATTSAHAVDGCKFLLCIAGPWSSISECVGTVHAVFRDLARGRPFPVCTMSGGPGNSANNAWVGESDCPSMYRQYSAESGAYTGCTYPGRISVYVNGGLWSQVYWNMGGGTTTWYSDTARSSLTSTPGSLPLDDTFVNDLTSWNTQVVSCRAAGGTADSDAFGAFQRCNMPETGGGG